MHTIAMVKQIADLKRKRRILRIDEPVNIRIFSQYCSLTGKLFLIFNNFIEDFQIFE